MKRRSIYSWANTNCKYATNTLCYCVDREIYMHIVLLFKAGTVELIIRIFSSKISHLISMLS